MKIAVLGSYGVEGKANARFLRKKYPKAELVMLDRRHGKNYLKNLSDFDIIYRTPGISYNLKEIQKALRKGVNVTSGTEVFLAGARGTVIGITGTKGKGTTATLIHMVLKSAGRDVYLAGNIGKPALDLMHKLNKNSITVLELSSFQLQGINYSPHIAVVLDIFPDHLDAHKNFREYIDAKSNIATHQKHDDLIFYVPDNKYSAEIANLSAGKKIAVSQTSFPVNLKIPGAHNVKNAAMAAAVVSHFDVSPIITIGVINNFMGLPFRLKLTRKIGGISIYNDSASTNPQTTAAALASFPGKPKVLIAGGKDKNLNYRPVADSVSRENIRSVVLFGENRAKIKKAIGAGVKIHNSNNLRSAVNAAMKLSKPGDIIIFSPGASSFDMFTSYIERGEEFDSIVKNLKS